MTSDYAADDGGSPQSWSVGERGSTATCQQEATRKVGIETEAKMNWRGEFGRRGG